jgi:hypothetical protein
VVHEKYLCCHMHIQVVIQSHSPQDWLNESSVALQMAGINSFSSTDFIVHKHTTVVGRVMLVYRKAIVW